MTASPVAVLVLVGVVVGGLVDVGAVVLAVGLVVVVVLGGLVVVVVGGFVVVPAEDGVVVVGDDELVGRAVLVVGLGAVDVVEEFRDDVVLGTVPSVSGADFV